jgi:hypothetical protein
VQRSRGRLADALSWLLPLQQQGVSGYAPGLHVRLLLNFRQRFSQLAAPVADVPDHEFKLCIFRAQIPSKNSAKNSTASTQVFADCSSVQCSCASRRSPINLSTKGRPCEERADIPKSNWSYPIDKGPFLAFNVTPGITFGFGGLRISTRSQVLNTARNPIPGLFAADELVGVFFGGYLAVYSGALPVEKRHNHKLRFGY